jgi:hypothetical protein
MDYYNRLDNYEASAAASVTGKPLFFDGRFRRVNPAVLANIYLSRYARLVRSGGHRAECNALARALTVLGVSV